MDLQIACSVDSTCLVHNGLVSLPLVLLSQQESAGVEQHHPMPGRDKVMQDK